MGTEAGEALGEGPGQREVERPTGVLPSRFCPGQCRVGSSPVTGPESRAQRQGRRLLPGPEHVSVSDP